MIIGLLASPLFWTIVLGAIALWLLTTLHTRTGRYAGSLLGAVALGLLAAYLPHLGPWLEQVLFWLLAGTAVASAVAMISLRSPVYSAMCFGLTLLTTAGLFLLQGAQFLGVATVVVYAGAILVTFLFVLMLAQPEGQAYYDRISWGHFPAVVAAITAALIVAGLAYTVTHLEGVEDRYAAAEMADGGVLDPQHVAHLGGYMFSRHLISVQVAGALLLAALVGAVAIVIQGKQPPEAGREGAEHV